MTTLVGVSGGADSVALLIGLTRLRPKDAQGRLIAVHFNHLLRGTRSDADEQFVVDLSDRLG